MLFQQLLEGGMDGNLVEAERHRSLNTRTENHRSAVCLKRSLDVVPLRDNQCTQEIAAFAVDDRLVNAFIREQ